MNHLRKALGWALAVTLLGAAAPAFGQGANHSNSSDQADGGAALAEGNRNADRNKRQAAGAVKSVHRTDADVPWTAWKSFVFSLDLTADQRRQVTKFATDYRQKQSQFLRANDQKLRALQRKFNEFRKNNEQPSAELRKQLHALRNAAPSAADFQKRVRALLTEEQRSSLQGHINKSRTTVIERNHERLSQSRTAAGEGAAATADPVKRNHDRLTRNRRAAGSKLQSGAKKSESGQRAAQPPQRTKKATPGSRMTRENDSARD